MRFIGDSINEAIDWTQDCLGTTRPIAESMLFTLLTEKKACETEDGFMLAEEMDEDELKRRAKFHRPRWQMWGEKSRFNMRVSRTQKKRIEHAYREHQTDHHTHTKQHETMTHTAIVQKGDTAVDLGGSPAHEAEKVDDDDRPN